MNIYFLKYRCLVKKGLLPHQKGLGLGLRLGSLPKDPNHHGH